MFCLDRRFQRWSVPVDSEDYETEVVAVLENANKKYSDKIQLCIKVGYMQPQLNTKLEQFSNKIVDITIDGKGYERYCHPV